MKLATPSLQQTTCADLQHILKLKQEIVSDSLYGICSNLSRSHYGLYEEFNYTLKFLATEAVPYLKAQHQQVDDKITEWKEIILVASKERKDACATYVRDQKNVSKPCADANRAYQRLKENTNPKAEQKLNEALIQSIVHYRSALSTAKSSLKTLNEKHQKLMKLIKHGIQALKSSQSLQTSSAHSILLSVHKIFRTITDESDNALSIELIQPHWEKHFIQFVVGMGISRGQLLPKKFVDIPLNLLNDRIEAKRYEYEEPDNCLPLCVGKINHNFTGTDQYEMTVTAGQIVYLFEMPKFDWCCVSSLNKSNIGYVPTTIIDVIENSKIAFALYEHKAEGNGELTIQAGELLVVKETRGGKAICTNSQAKEGTVALNLLCIKNC
ncbi:Variant SH3 domain containing protein [Histomonas meleagridis]|uniref:Variant SH3 domain containing protein n=1 Tax=Histomonas meleagridis TaxID=135588 RepID=UPI00355980D5|nr:Variant SH3 domain containing protein [Histomonas meleagridis]KAH0806742.1 Variant SH3 domain containing protein [Histomonas meleagridis]